MRHAGTSELALTSIKNIVTRLEISGECVSLSVAFIACRWIFGDSTVANILNGPVERKPTVVLARIRRAVVQVDLASVAAKAGHAGAVELAHAVHAGAVVQAAHTAGGSEWMELFG